jgi:regulatory protein
VSASQARLAALRMLNRRDYTVAELRERLLKKEHVPADIDEALAGLVSSGLADDRRVAVSAVRVSASVKGRGRHRIARELEARGVDKALIGEVLDALSPDDELEAVRAFLERKRLPARLSAQEHRRVFGQLLRRGFSADLIARVIRERQTR